MLHHKNKVQAEAIYLDSQLDTGSSGDGGADRVHGKFPWVLPVNSAARPELGGTCIPEELSYVLTIELS